MEALVTIWSFTEGKKIHPMPTKQSIIVAKNSNIKELCIWIVYLEDLAVQFDSKQQW